MRNPGRAWLPGLVASVVVVASGCVSIPNGLCSTDGTDGSYFDQRLIGQWAPVVPSADGPRIADMTRYSRREDERNTYVVDQPDDPGWWSFAHLVEVGGVDYLDVFAADSRVDAIDFLEKAQRWNAARVVHSESDWDRLNLVYLLDKTDPPGDLSQSLVPRKPKALDHRFSKVSIRGDTMVVQAMNLNYLVNHPEALTRRVKPNADPKLRTCAFVGADSDEVRTFLAMHADDSELWPAANRVTFRRVETGRQPAQGLAAATSRTR